VIPETTSTGTYELRSYRDADEEQTLALLTASLGAGPTGERSELFFRWKHLDNPFGRSFMLVVTEGEQIIGFRSFMRWRLRSGDTELPAVRAVDTATHPDHQGRGIFSMLTRRAIDELRSEVDLVFNTPNQKSGPGYLKMGWVLAGQVPIRIRVKHPIRFVRGVRSFKETTTPPREHPRVDAESAASALEDDTSISQLLEESRTHDRRLHTPRTVDYLRWRYGSAPGLDYRAVRHERGGRLLGLALFRVRPRGELWEATVCEIIGRPGDGATARRVLREVMRRARADHLTSHFPEGTVQKSASTRVGFLRSPAGLQFTVNDLRPAGALDHARLGSWALTLGDLEVF
jgi:GNAT superfamily N-acetyltransferase